MSVKKYGEKIELESEDMNYSIASIMSNKKGS
jgi:hypothetical protein